MKLYRLALCALLLGGCVTVNNPTVNATANTAIDATANTQVNTVVEAGVVEGAPAAMAEPAPGASPAATQAKVYQDYAYSFSYPGGWTPKDVSLQEFYGWMGLTVDPGVAGKVATLVGVNPVAKVAVASIEKSTLPEAAQASPVAQGPAKEFYIDGAQGVRIENQGFKDGSSFYLFSYTVDRGSVRYSILIESGADSSLETMDQMEQLIIGTWKWK